MPGQVPLTGETRPDITFHLLAHHDESTGPANDRWSTFYQSPYRDPKGLPLLIVDRLQNKNGFRFSYQDGCRFWIRGNGKELWASWPQNYTQEDAVTYLLGPVLGFMLRLRGRICLHASAIVLGGKAVAFVGSAGAGKSTTTAGFARLGFPILSDDVVCVSPGDPQLLISPAYPQLGLWPEATELLFGSADALPRQTPNWEKRYLDLTQPGYQFQHQPVPLAAVYLLGERSAEERAPFIEPVAPQAGLMTLVANTYVNYLLDKEMRAREFEFLGSLVKRIPLRLVRPHTDARRLPRLCQTIADDFLALSPSEAAKT